MTDMEKVSAAKRAYMHDWRQRNAEKVNAYMRNWRSKNPEKVKAINEQYWLRRYNAATPEN